MINKNHSKSTYFYRYFDKDSTLYLLNHLAKFSYSSIIIVERLIIVISCPSLKSNADLYRVFTALMIYIYILQINAVIIEGCIAFYR